MPVSLAVALSRLGEHKAELRARGVRHAAVFGSVAQGTERPDSDIDVLVELDPEHEMGVFDYARLRLEIDRILGGAADVVNRRTLKPLLREPVLRNAVEAF